MPVPPRTSTRSSGVSFALHATGTQPAIPAIPAAAASAGSTRSGRRSGSSRRHGDLLGEEARLADAAAVAEQVDERPLRGAADGLAPGHVGERRVAAVEAPRADREVERVERDRLDADEDLALAGPGLVELGRLRR